MKLLESRTMRPLALAVGGAMLVPTLAGCGSNQQTSEIPPPVDMSSRQPPPGAGMPPKANTGMSNKTKLVLLAGAAALYYMYKKKQDANGQAIQYYRSESTGRIYYRDPKSKQAKWVTPPRQPIQVPAEQAQEYQQYQGYNQQNTGEQFSGFGYNPNGNYQVPSGAVR